MAVTGHRAPVRREHRMPRDESLTATSQVDTAREFLDLLTVEDVAALLKVNKSWVYEHTRTRGAPRVRARRQDPIVFLTSRSASTCASIHSFYAPSSIDVLQGADTRPSLSAQQRGCEAVRIRETSRRR